MRNLVLFLFFFPLVSKTQPLSTADSLVTVQINQHYNKTKYTFQVPVEFDTITKTIRSSCTGVSITTNLSSSKDQNYYVQNLGWFDEIVCETLRLSTIAFHESTFNKPFKPYYSGSKEHIDFYLKRRKTFSPIEFSYLNVLPIDHYKNGYAFAYPNQYSTTFFTQTKINVFIITYDSYLYSFTITSTKHSKEKLIEICNQIVSTLTIEEYYGYEVPTTDVHRTDFVSYQR